VGAIFPHFIALLAAATLAERYQPPAQEDARAALDILEGRTAGEPGWMRNRLSVLRGAIAPLDATAPI